MKKLSQTFCSGIVLLFGLAGAAHAETLQEAYALALQSDPVLAAAEAQYRSVLEAKPQARAALLPQLNAQAAIYDKDVTYDDASPVFQDAHYRRKNWGLSLDQALFNRQAWLRLAQADLQLAQAEAQVQAERQALVVRLAEAYFDVLAAQDNLEFAKAEKTAISRQLEQTRERFRVGMLAITDVRESEAQFDLSVAQAIDAANQLDIARESLEVITGQLSTELAGLREDFVPSAPTPDDLTAWVDQALKNSLALRAAQFAVELAEKEVANRKAGHLPTLGLGADYGVQDDSGGFSEGKATDVTVGLTLVVPLYTGGLTSARVVEGQQLKAKAQQQYEQQKRETIRQTRASYLSVLSGISRVSALRQALSSTQTAADATKAGFEVGTRTSVDVLLALRETYRARRDYARARYDYIVSTLKLKQATGLLSAEDLTEIKTGMKM